MSEVTPGPGADLKAARESLQVSVREVADALNLPGRVIEALEADDYDRLPPTVFTRGYLRSYARLLELPVDQLLARYPEVTEEVEIASDTRTGAHAVISQSRQLILPLAIVTVIVVLLLVWLLRDDEPQATDARPSESRSEPMTRPATISPETEPPAGMRTVPARPPTVPEEPEAAVERAAAPAAEVREAPSAEQAASRSAAAVEPAPADLPEPPASQTATPVERPPAVVTATGSTSERRITEFGDDRLVFRFTEDCWLEVKTLDGENLYSDLNRAGSTLELTGRAPFRVLIGYAPGVSLEFNGEPVALSRYARNNVASLVLGQ